MKAALLQQVYKRSCGPACLVMAARTFAVDITEKDAIKRLGGLRSFGVDTVQLAGLAREMGLRVVCYSLSKTGDPVRRGEPKPSILQNASARGQLVLLTVDRQVLAGRAFSRRLHNILLTRFGLRVCRYADPADGKIHHIAASQLCSAWEESARKASAHAVVLGRRYKPANIVEI